MQLANALTLPSAGRNPHGFSTEVPRGGRASDHTRLTLPGLGRGAQGKGTRECSGMQRRWEQPCRWSFLRRARLAAGEGGRESQGVPGCKRRAPSRPVPSPRRGPAPSQPPHRPGCFRVAGLRERVSGTCLPGRPAEGRGRTEGKGSENRAEGLLTWPLAGGGQEAGQQQDDEAQQLLEPHPRGPWYRGVPGSGGQGEQRPGSGRLT